MPPGEAAEGHVFPLVGGLAPLRVLEAMGERERRALLDDISTAGVSHLLSEGALLPDWLVGEAAEAGLRVGGGVACFSDHAGSFAPVRQELRPIAADGRPRPAMEWYQGIIPTDRTYEEDLVQACVRAASQAALDLFALDFIRWPIHWELELRDGAKVVDSSFDPTTLRRFVEETGIDVPVDGPVAAAARLQNELVAEWTDFKCRVITGLVERIASEIRRARLGLRIGAFVVPGDEGQRRRYAGQDVRALAQHLDLLLPMTYHAILHRPPGWVGELVSDMRASASVPVIAVVQATADESVAGSYDWGSSFDPGELGRAIDAALDAGSHGFVVFPAHGLDAARWTEVRLRADRLPPR